MTIFVGSYGIQLVFGVGYNMVAFTTLELTFTKPDDTTLVVNNTSPSPVALGGTDLPTDVGVFLTNQYVTYTFTAGQLDQSGNWNVRLRYVDANKQLYSKQGRFVLCAL